MARPRTTLQEILSSIEGVVAAYFQPPTVMKYPCIRYNRDGSWVEHADNLKYDVKKRYQVTVIDRDPDSPIPDLVEALPECTFDRWYATDGLNHWVYTIYF